LGILAPTAVNRSGLFRNSTTSSTPTTSVNVTLCHLRVLPPGRGSSECRWWQHDQWLACVSPPPRPTGRFCHRKCRGRFYHRMLLQ
jgi:hypothetical protein